MTHIHTYAAPESAAVAEGSSAEAVVADRLKQIERKLRNLLDGRASPNTDFESWSVRCLLVHNGLGGRSTQYSISVALELSDATANSVVLSPAISIDPVVRREGSKLNWRPDDPDPWIESLLEEITHALE